MININKQTFQTPMTFRMIKKTSSTKYIIERITY